MRQDAVEHATANQLDSLVNTSRIRHLKGIATASWHLPASEAATAALELEFHTKKFR